MNDGLVVHIINTLTNLSNEENAVSFSQCEIIGYDSFKQFPACDAVKSDINYYLFQWNFTFVETAAISDNPDHETTLSMNQLTIPSP